MPTAIQRTDLGDLKGLAPRPPACSHTAPRAPNEIPTLDKQQKKCHSDDERLVNGMDGYDSISPVIVPQVYCDYHGIDNAEGWWWYEDFFLEFPPSSMSRDAAWQEIVDGGSEVPEGVPRRLCDSWDLAKRSREYLNGHMDKFDLDNLYYIEDYVEEREVV